MRGFELELTEAGVDDIAAILDYSAKQFGAAARVRYEVLIAVGIEDLRDDPFRPTSADRPELAVRTYHLRHCRTRATTADGAVSVPRHILVYEAPSPNVVRIMRVLHEAMELERHIPDDEEPGAS